MNRGLERPAKAEIDADAVGCQPAAVMAPAGAERGGQRKPIARDDVGGQFRADARLQMARNEGARPDLPGIGKEGRVDRMDQDRPRANAALWNRYRPAIVHVEEGHMRASE